MMEGKDKEKGRGIGWSGRAVHLEEKGNISSNLWLLAGEVWELL